MMSGTDHRVDCRRHVVVLRRCAGSGQTASADSRGTGEREVASMLTRPAAFTDVLRYYVMSCRQRCGEVYFDELAGEPESCDPEQRARGGERGPDGGLD